MSAPKQRTPRTDHRRLPAVPVVGPDPSGDLVSPRKPAEGPEDKVSGIRSKQRLSGTVYEVRWRDGNRRSQSHTVHGSLEE